MVWQVPSSRGKTKGVWVRRLASAFHSFHVLCGRPKLKAQSRSSQPQTQTQTQTPTQRDMMASQSLTTLSVSPTWSFRRQSPSVPPSTASVSSSASFASRRSRSHVVRMAPEEEKLTRRNPLDFPIEWERPKPGRRPDIFPQFSPMKTPLPPPMPYDPPEEDEEEEEKKEEEEEQEQEEDSPEKLDPDKNNSVFGFW